MISKKCLGIPPGKASASRERVLETAAKVLAERGYAGTTMRMIANRAGLEAGSLYYHFDSKEKLVESVLSHGLVEHAAELRLSVSSVPPGTNTRQLFMRAVKAHMECLFRHGDYALASRRILNQVDPGVRANLVRLRDDIDSFWQDLLEKARDSGELHKDIDLFLLRSFVLGALNSSLEWYKPQGKSIADISSQFSLIITEAVFE